MLFLFAILVLLFGIFYAGLFIWFLRGWQKLEQGKNKISTVDSAVFFSIIVPARDEEENILNTLNDLAEQDYDKNWFEVIIVDDFSSDRTPAIVKDFIRVHPGFHCRLLSMRDIARHPAKAFKKHSIAEAIKQSKHPWIITTDADCRRGSSWLSTLATFIARHEPVLVSAPVIYEHDDSFFQKAQALEFIGLIGIGGASIANGSPNLCNGANLAYKKEAYNDVGGFSDIDTIASGDDELLMHKIHRFWPRGIMFVKNTDAAVYTKPVNTLKAFIRQRKRWVSKSAKYQKKRITLILTGAYIFNLLLLISFIAGFFELRFFVVFIHAMAFKLIFEWLFLRKVIKYFNLKGLMSVFIPAAALYVPYVLFIGIYGNFGGYYWKGRKLR